MKIHEVFTPKTEDDKYKPFIFVIDSERSNFTAIQVNEKNGLGETIQLWEIYTTEGVLSYQEFCTETILENLSRLSESYLNFAKEFCEERLEDEYSDYLNNWQEYEFWVETLEKIKVEIQERNEEEKNI